MGKRLAPEVKDEIFRLRIEERLSCVEIAQRVGSTRASYVAQLLRGHPLTPEERHARKVAQAEDMRRKRADDGKIIGGDPWSKEEDAQIRKFFPGASQERVLAALPGRSWTSVHRRASHLKVRRDRATGLANKRKDRNKCDKVFQYLREVRLNRGMTQADVADRIGTHKVGVTKWEGGVIKPSFFMFRAWLDALDCDIEVIQKDGGRIRRGTTWWPQEDSLLTELSGQGASLAEMATALKRRPAAIERRLKELGLTESETARNASGMMRARLGT